MTSLKQQPSARIRFGLAWKLLLINLAIVGLVSVVLGVRASAQLEDSMIAGFKSKGQAIALSLAAATEQSVASSISSVQGSIDSNKVIEGVKYIYIQDDEGEVLVHTFSPAFPEALRTINQVTLGELSDKEPVKVDLNVEVDADGKRLRAIDIAAPVSGGALGVVHVGMDREMIQAEVAALQGSMLLWGALIAAVGTLIAVMLVMFMVVRPIRELTRVTSEIVSNGDLTQRIDVSSSDEIGQLAKSFSMMVAKLRDIPMSLEESASLLSNAVANLTESTGEQNATLTRQAAALQETQVTAQEIKQTSVVAAQKAEAVLKVAERADEISREGEASIEQSLTGLQEIRSQVSEIAEKIKELSDRTRQIGSITATVKDLADQSNMLALNAAIEAVRSGEHGKGFGVVAREIRSLADQSIRATDRVREILEDISGAIVMAVEITERGAEKMEAGLLQVRTSGQNLRQLSGIVQDNSSAVRQIAAAVSQQNAGITQIFSAVTDLSKMMDDTVKGIHNTNDAASTLQSVSTQVSAVVKSYRV